MSGLAARSLQAGATVFAIGILIFFAARSVNGGLAGILLSALISSIAVGAALGMVTGAWHEAQRVGPRHAVLGGCLTGVALCGTGGVVLCFGSQLLFGALVGGALAFVNHRQGWIDWRQVVGGDPAPAAAPLVAFNTPAGRAGGVAVALALVAAGIFLGGQGAIRALETTGVAGDIGCTAPCGMQHGLWVQIVPDGDGRTASRAAADVVEIRLSFHDDAPGGRDVSRGDFTLSSPDGEVTYGSSEGQPECGAWRMRLQLDDAGRTALLCFSVPAGVDTAQLDVNWGTVVMPLGNAQPNFSLALFVKPLVPAPPLRERIQLLGDSGR